MITMKTAHKMPAPTRTDVGLISIAILLRVARFITHSPFLLRPWMALLHRPSQLAAKAAQTYTQRLPRPREKYLEGFLAPARHLSTAGMNTPWQELRPCIDSATRNVAESSVPLFRVEVPLEALQPETPRSCPLVHKLTE